jgi:phage tail sheath protein FI
MVASYKTPGVYIEEIPRFPPSVAPVETAIPAFIGYTEKANDVRPNDLHLKPTRISSMVEYETYFGLPQKETAFTVAGTVTTSSGVTTSQRAVADLPETARSKHIMYYALQMFFANGGGPCYIVSVGLYKTLGNALVETELQGGLDAVKKEDEPTLILFPEGQSLSIADFKTLQDAALAQCAELMDRFVIMDVHGDGISMSNPSANLLIAVNNFRTSGIGTNNLKYGGAYAPNLETVLNFAVDEAQTDVTITTDGVAAAAVALDTLRSGNNVVLCPVRARGHRRTDPRQDCRLEEEGDVDGRYCAARLRRERALTRRQPCRGRDRALHLRPLS